MLMNERLNGNKHNNEEEHLRKRNGNERYLYILHAREEKHLLKSCNAEHLAPDLHWRLRGLIARTSRALPCRSIRSQCSNVRPHR